MKGRIKNISEYRPGDLQGPFQGAVSYTLGPKDYNLLIGVEMSPLSEETYFVSQELVVEAGRDDIAVGDEISFSHTKKAEPIGSTGFSAQRIVKLQFLSSKPK